MTIYFDSAGNRLATPIVRKQPLLSTVDGVSTTFFPPTASTDTFRTRRTEPPPIRATATATAIANFFGTSAAAPHAAGCAALMHQRRHRQRPHGHPGGHQVADGEHDPGPERSGPRRRQRHGWCDDVQLPSDRGTYADPQAYTITYNGAPGTTLNTLVFDLSESPLPGGDFYPSRPIAVTTGAAKSGTTGGTAPAIATSTVSGRHARASQTLTLTLTNFVPGSTLSFGVCADRHECPLGNYYIHGDQLAGATITATDSTGTSSHPASLANTYSKKWNYKTGYGLVDVNAAIKKMLGQ